MFSRILHDAFTLVFRNLETVFKACGAWFVLQFVLIVILQMTVGRSLETTPGSATIFPEVTPALIAANVVILIVSVLASASIAVAWHRFALLGEQPGLIHLKFGRVEAGFLLRSLQLSLIFALGLGIMVTLHVLLRMPVITGLSALVIAIVALPAFLRLSLILPAAAVERPLQLKQAYELGEGLGWTMLGASLALGLPLIAVNRGLQFLFSAVDGGMLALLVSIKLALLDVLVQIIVTVLGITVLSAGYRLAMERAASNSPDAS